MASESGARTENAPQDVFSRLVRSFSGKTGLSSSSAASTPSVEDQTMLISPSTMPTSPSTTASGEPLQRVSSSSSSITRARLKIAERLKQLGKDIGNLRKGSGNKSVPASPRITLGEVSPATPTPAAQISGHAKLLSMVAELEEPEATSSTGNSDDPPSATTLAKRIQALVDALPFPAPGQSRVIKPKIPAHERDGRPIPPPNTTPVNDSRLIKFLSSPTIMNGSTVKGRPSIWSILENIGVPPHAYPPTNQDTVEDGGSADDGNNDDGQVDVTDTTSVMLYSPLIPGAEDLVELAEQVPVHVSEESHGPGPLAGTSWTSVWPLSIWYNSSSLSESAFPSYAATSVDGGNRMVRVKTAKAWVPSATKLSVQAFWWGYRLYLPPPVIAILSDQTLEATKRAAMITTALTWIFNNLPISALPPPLQPAALLLQRLVPFLGYIGTFISWSWSTIKSYDIGFGVILSATWLLPVALIPGTWREDAFPKSPGAPCPIPLPPQTPSSPPSSLPTSPSIPSTTPGPSSPSAPTSPSIPSTTPGPFSPMYLPTSPSTDPSATPASPISVEILPMSPGNATTITSPVESIDIPIPLSPVYPPPLPPIPTTPGVLVGSPLSEQLLQGPLLSPIPLPEENADRKTKRRSRAKALFTRSPKH